MVTRHLFEIDEGMEWIFAHGPNACERHRHNYAHTSNDQHASANPAGFTQSNTKSCKSDPTFAKHHQADCRKFQFWTDKKRETQQTRSGHSTRQSSSERQRSAHRR